MSKRPTLADVLAEPDDLDLRMVWADALQEREDPRGELAAIQRAPLTYATWIREAELVAKHGKDWAKPIGEYFAGPLVFEGGVFAGAQPAYGFDPDPDDPVGTPGASFDDPAWRAITTLVEPDYGTRILAVPHVPIRRLRGIWELAAIDLLQKYAKRPLERVIELGVRTQGDGSPGTKLFRACAALPNLRTLTIHAPRPHLVSALVGSPVIKRIERLGIEGHDRFSGDGTAKLIEAAIASRGALREVVIRFSEHAKDLGWQVTLRRDRPGPFTSIVAWWRKGQKARAPKDLAIDCVHILNLVDRKAVRSLSIETGKPQRFPSDSLRVLAEQLAEMPLEHCVVPWQATPRKQAAAGEQRWHLEISQANALEQIARAWQVLGPELGVAWDAMSADGRGTPSLGKNPLATLRKRAKGKLHDALAVVRVGTSDAIEITRWGWIRGTFTSARSPAELASWFASAIATLAPEGLATCGHPDDSPAVNPFDLETYGAADAGWVVALPPNISKGLTPKHLAKLGALAVACPDRTRVVFTIGDDPAKVDAKRARAFAAELVAVLDEIRASKAPKWFAPLMREKVAPYAKQFKVTKAADTPMRLVWARGKRFIRVRLDDTGGAWRMQVETSGFSGGSTEIRKPADAEAELHQLARYI